jgi:hypothetical protein
MVLATCDQLVLPRELVSLVKSYTWHDLEVKKRKYEVIQQLKLTQQTTKVTRILNKDYITYIRQHDNVNITCSFCGKCGDYVATTRLLFDIPEWCRHSPCVPCV